MERAAPATELVSLAARARRGDQRALERLLAEVHVQLRRYFSRWLFRRSGWEDTVDDLAQDALIRVARGLAGCTAGNDGMLLEWARTVARNVGTDYLRRRREEWDQREFVAEIEAVVDSDEWEREIDDDGQSIMLRLLAAAHAAEPADVQTVLWHHLVEGDEWSATGDAMGIAHTAAKRRFQRAQKRLRHAVLKRLIDLPPDELRAVRRWLEHIDLAVSPFIRTGPGDA